MSTYTVNKGVGHDVEFHALTAQYLVIFAGGLLGCFLLAVLLSVCGVGQWVSVGIGVACALGLVWGTFRLNARYGRYGLLKIGAARMRPRRIIRRKRIRCLLQKTF